MSFIAKLLANKPMEIKNMADYIKPNWPAPLSVNAFSTTRQGGYSLAPYHAFNLGQHVGDDAIAVEKNRTKLMADLILPTPPVWIKQIHSSIVLPVELASATTPADATYTTKKQRVCAVLTADCLPILLCNRAGTEVAAIHAGWRGLAANIIGNTIQALTTKPSELMAWLGPAIGPTAFEVGDEVRTEFLAQGTEYAAAFITKNPSNTVYNDPVANKWLANIYRIATQSLAKCGVADVFGGNYCTYSQNELFFSYRRDQQTTGRMATLIWLED